jgi:5'-methylthioadenosine phosphorylase
MTEIYKEPAIGIIGGSGLYEIDSLESIQRHHLSTPFGSPSDTIIEGLLKGRRVCFLPRHGLGHRIMAHEINHRANVWALRSLNVRWVVSVTAVDSLREEYAPRHVVVPDQLVDRTGKGEQHTFFGGGIAAHVSFADPYCAEMRRILLQASRAHLSETHDGGVYGCMNGPAFSTRAESKMHRALGFDLIGMSNAGEARLCREAEIACATLALVTDYDCWREGEAVDVASVIENLQANGALARQIIRTVVGLVPVVADWATHRSLDTAILTPREAWSAEKKQDLEPLLRRFAQPD